MKTHSIYVNGESHAAGSVRDRIAKYGIEREKIDQLLSMGYVQSNGQNLVARSRELDDEIQRLEELAKVMRGNGGG